jgi:hypothetical protein
MKGGPTNNGCAHRCVLGSGTAACAAGGTQRCASVSRARRAAAWPRHPHTRTPACRPCTHEPLASSAHTPGSSMQGATHMCQCTHNRKPPWDTIDRPEPHSLHAAAACAASTTASFLARTHPQTHTAHTQIMPSTAAAAAKKHKVSVRGRLPSEAAKAAGTPHPHTHTRSSSSSSSTQRNTGCPHWQRVQRRVAVCWRCRRRWLLGKGGAAPSSAAG